MQGQVRAQAQRRARRRSLLSSSPAHPDFGDERIYFKQEFRLTFAHWRQVRFSGLCFVDCEGEFMDSFLLLFGLAQENG